MAQTPEGLVKKLIDEKLKELTPDCWYFKPVSIGMGAHGVPDFVGCYRGLFFAIEAKKPGGKTTALQNLQIGKILEAEGLVTVVDSPESLEAFLVELKMRTGGYIK